MLHGLWSQPLAWLQSLPFQPLWQVQAPLVLSHRAPFAHPWHLHVCESPLAVQVAPLLHGLWSQPVAWSQLSPLHPLSQWQLFCFEPPDCLQSPWLLQSLLP